MILLTDNTNPADLVMAVNGADVINDAVADSDNANIFINTIDDILKPRDVITYFSNFPNKALNIGLRVLIALIVFIIGVQLIRFILFILKKFTKRLKVEKGVKTFIQSFIKTALYIALIMLIGNYFGIDAVSIGALLASAGVTVGLALQGTLSNLAGGVLILLTNPFKVGDYIVDSSSGKEGTVDEIKICYTKLKTFDNQMVTLPNGNLANSAVTNVTKENTRRLDINVGISYTSSIDLARETIMHLLDEDESVLKDKERRVVVTNLGSSSVDLCVRFWVKTSDYWDTKFRITENCKKSLDAAGVKIPYTQMDVHLVQKD